MTQKVTVPVPARTLDRWNRAMGAIHALLCVVTLTAGNAALTVPVYRTSLDFQVYNATDGTFVSQRGKAVEDEGDAWRLVPYYEARGSLAVTVATAAFFLLSAGFHVGNAFVWRAFYLDALADCRSPTRWIEYFFSAPLMFVLIAYGLGVRGRTELVQGATLVAITMPFGYWTELLARPASLDAWRAPLRVRLAPWALGHVPQTVAWAGVILQFYDNGWDLSKVPAFVHAILWAELVLFFSFGGAALLAQLAPPRHFARGEVAFQALSLASKATLGVLLLWNVLMLSRFDDIY